jgi:hypothetical protein
LSIAACLSRRKRSDDRRQEKPSKPSSSTLKIQVEPLKISPTDAQTLHRTGYTSAPYNKKCE